MEASAVMPGAPHSAASTRDLHVRSRALLRAIDRPAHEAVRLARGPWMRLFSPGLLGVALIATACLIVSLPGLLGTGGDGSPAVDIEGLLALVETLLVVTPVMLSTAAYARLQLTPRVVIAALSVCLLVAGVVSMSSLPMVAYLLVNSRDVGFLLVVLSLIVPGLAFGSVLVILFRVFTTLDPSSRSRWMSRAFVVVSSAVFYERMAANIFPLVLY